MKKRSLVYSSFLVLIGISTYFIGGSLHMSTEEIIEKVSANNDTSLYENKIYHELRLSEYFVDDEPMSQTLEEWWVNPMDGENLSILRDPSTQEIIAVNGVTDQGDLYSYPSSGETINDWARTFAGDKYTCIDSLISDGWKAQGTLFIASEDPNVNTVNGSGISVMEGLPYVDGISNILEVSSLSGAAKIVDFAYQNQDVAIKLTTEKIDGDNYYVFEVTGEDSLITREFFNAETFQLERTQTLNTVSKEMSQITYLEVNYLDANESENIFRFDAYEMTLEPAIPATTYSLAMQNDGCYNSDHELMTEEDTEKLLAQIDPETVLQWESMAEEVLETSIERTDENFSDEDSFTENPVINTDIHFIQPTEGILTQLFYEKHLGVDFARKSDEDPLPKIVAIADGTVTEVHNDGWNGGSGQEIWITHADGFKSHYTHLSEISVELGETVSQGQEIGVMGNSGRTYGSTGIHLHFEMEYNGTKINPLHYFEIY